MAAPFRGQAATPEAQICVLESVGQSHGQNGPHVVVVEVGNELADDEKQKNVDGIVGPRKSREDSKNLVLTGRLTVIIKWPCHRGALAVPCVRHAESRGRRGSRRGWGRCGRSRWG